MVEVKTGTNVLETQQLENYLDVAREQGYQALIDGVLDAIDTFYAEVKADAPKPKPGLNTPVRDGKFEFTVTRVDQSGRTQIGDANFGTKAQGEFVFIELKIENIGDEPQTLFGDNQYLYDTRGRKFSVDSQAAIYVEGKTFLEEINPGNSVSGRLVFDVPKGTDFNKLELHDSVFSDGVEVALP